MIKSEKQFVFFVLNVEFSSLLDLFISFVQLWTCDDAAAAVA
jgi:hypothetical protein